MNILERFEEIEINLNKADFIYKLNGDINQFLICEKKQLNF